MQRCLEVYAEQTCLPFFQSWAATRWFSFSMSLARELLTCHKKKIVAILCSKTSVSWKIPHITLHVLKSYFDAYMQRGWFQFAKANLSSSESKIGSACRGVPSANLVINILKYKLLQMLVDALNYILDLNDCITGCMNSEAVRLKVAQGREKYFVT